MEMGQVGGEALVCQAQCVSESTGGLQTADYNGSSCSTQAQWRMEALLAAGAALVPRNGTETEAPAAAAATVRARTRGGGLRRRRVTMAVVLKGQQL